MWSQAIQNHISLLDMTQYGWKILIVEGKLECDWVSADNQAAVRELVGQTVCCFGAVHAPVVLHAALDVVVVYVSGLDVVLGAGVKLLQCSQYSS